MGTQADVCLWRGFLESAAKRTIHSSSSSRRINDNNRMYRHLSNIDSIQYHLLRQGRYKARLVADPQSAPFLQKHKQVQEIFLDLLALSGKLQVQ
jgi:hypothetical protein